jgi:hypothetical protein
VLVAAILHIAGCKGQRQTEDEKPVRPGELVANARASNWGLPGIVYYTSEYDGYRVVQQSRKVKPACGPFRCDQPSKASRFRYPASNMGRTENIALAENSWLVQGYRRAS